jgi:hypothetical protein
LETAADRRTHLKWPEDPYKGLTYYGREDVPLFAGRQTDVRQVARILGTGGTRILLLHGGTGCGKSSFIRAGLIPFLENQVERFHFARETSDSESALFVRSTFDPLLEMAAKAYQGACALGASDSSALTADLKRYPTAAEFNAAVAEDPERLVDVIGRIAYSRPRTQVLVVDQAEEVLTLKPGKDGDVARRRFFAFLAYLTHSSIDFRLIVAFRTEFHGRFYALLRSGAIEASAVDDYYLDELTVPDLVEAIKRPTSTEGYLGYEGTPRLKYHFCYEDQLPETIAADLAKTPLASGVLPVLQIVCRRLYQRALTTGPVRGDRVIRKVDYDRLGGVSGQVDLHLDQALERCTDHLGIRRLEAAFERMRWRDVLSELTKVHVDGSITTDVKRASVLQETADFRGCKLSFGAVMDFLEKEEWRIVRRVELTTANSTKKLECYSLGHDVLGTVLDNWHKARRHDRGALRTGFIIYGVGIIAATVGLSLLFRSALGEIVPPRLFMAVGVAVGSLVILLAAIPDSPRFARIYRPIYGFTSNVRALFRVRGSFGSR